VARGGGPRRRTRIGRDGCRLSPCCRCSNRRTGRSPSPGEQGEPCWNVFACFSSSGIGPSRPFGLARHTDRLVRSDHEPPSRRPLAPHATAGNDRRQLKHPGPRPRLAQHTVVPGALSRSSVCILPGMNETAPPHRPSGGPHRRRDRLRRPWAPRPALGALHAGVADRRMWSSLARHDVEPRLPGDRARCHADVGRSAIPPTARCVGVASHQTCSTCSTSCSSPGPMSSGPRSARDRRRGGARPARARLGVADPRRPGRRAARRGAGVVPPDLGRGGGGARPGRHRSGRSTSTCAPGSTVRVARPVRSIPRSGRFIARMQREAFEIPEWDAEQGA